MMRSHVGDDQHGAAAFERQPLGNIQLQ
jgi:hypothetical protein